MNRIKRIKIYNDTMKKCLNGAYGDLKAGKSYLFKNNESFLTKLERVKLFNTTKITVINDDVLNVAKGKFDIYYSG